MWWLSEMIFFLGHWRKYFSKLKKLLDILKWMQCHIIYLECDQNVYYLLITFGLSLKLTFLFLIRVHWMKRQVKAVCISGMICVSPSGWFLFPIPSRITCCLDLKTSVWEGQYNLAWQVWVITLDWLFFVPMIYSPSGSSVHGVLQARILEQVAMFSSRESAWPRDWTHISCVSCVGSQILYCWDTREASQYGPGRSKQHQDAP